MSLESVLRERLAALAPESLEVTDDSAAHAGHAGAAPGGNTHWSIAIVARAFEGKPVVARLIRSKRPDLQRVDRVVHQIAERGVHHAMAREHGLALEGARDDEDAPVRVASGRGARVPGVRGAVVRDFERIGRQTGQALAQDALHAHGLSPSST